LIPVFHLLSAYAMTSMSHVPDDARLPKVFEGLVLVCEALSSIGLKVQGEKDLQVGVGMRGKEEGSDGDLIQEMKDPEDGTGLIKPIIGISASSYTELRGAYIHRINTLA
jgi:ataxin-10